MAGSSAASYFGHKMYLPGAALVVATLVTYLPVLSNTWIWDDDLYVTQNSTLRTAEGLKRMWFDLRAEPFDVHVDETCVAEVVVAPHLAQQLFTREDATATKSTRHQHVREATSWRLISTAVALAF